jgi:hypothetical protein
VFFIPLAVVEGVVVVAVVVDNMGRTVEDLLNQLKISEP